MPFCSQCGNQVGATEAYCRQCGAGQPVGPATSPSGADPLAGIPPRTASILCYLPGIGWIASIIVLASEKFRRNRNVRFHAFQGLYLFVAWLMNAWVIRPICSVSPHLEVDKLIGLALLIMSVFMMIKASHDQAYSLPLFGELAERSVAEG